MKKNLLPFSLLSISTVMLVSFLFVPLFVHKSYGCTVTTSPTTVPANTDTTINFSFTNDDSLFPYSVSQFQAVPDNAILSNAQTSNPGWTVGSNAIVWTFLGGSSNPGSEIPFGGTQSGDSFTINATSDTDIFWSPAYNGTGFSEPCISTISVTNPTTPNITFSGATINQGGTYSTTGSFTDPNSSATSWTATVDYGDGSGEQTLALNADKTFSLSHLYQDNGQGHLIDPLVGQISITDGKYIVTVTVTNNQGALGNKRGVVTVNDTPPTLGAITVTTSPVQVNTPITASANFTDGVLDTPVASWDWGDGSTSTCNPNSFQCASLTESNGSGSVSATHTYTTSGVYTVTLTMNNGYNGRNETSSEQTDFLQGAVPVTTTYQVTVNVANTPPTVGTITVSTNPVQINTATTASANFTDPGVLDTHTASWNWGDGNTTSGTVTESNGSGSVSDSHTYTTAGVYPVTLTVTDNNGASGSSTFQYVSVYNPTSQGLFSAGQHFTSPAGAYTANTSLTGTVKFGLSYKYQGTVPTGNRQFSMDFNAANLHFNATTVNALVIANGMGTLTGTGTITGLSGTYNFLVTGSESANTIRIQITDPSNNNNVIYDTQPGAAATATPTTSVTGNVLAH